MPGARDLTEALDPGGVEGLAGLEGMQLARDVEPQREPGDRAVAESLQGGLGRIVLEESEMPLEDLHEWPK
jgi:hypothetical protein